MASAIAANPSAFRSFRPSEAAAADIFSAIATGRVSLADLAAAHSTTLEALTLWLEEPDTSERHTRLNAGFAAAVRTATLCHLPAAIPALARILRDFTSHTTVPSAAAASSPPDLPARDPAREQIRFATLALRAASLLHRLSRVSGDAPRKLLPRQGEVAAQRPEGATAFPTSPFYLQDHVPVTPLPSVPSTFDTATKLPQGGAVEQARFGRGETEGAPASSKSPLPAQLNESPHHFAPAPDSLRNPDPETRTPISDSSSLTSTLDSLESLSDEELFAAVERGDIDPAALFAAAGLTAGPAP